MSRILHKDNIYKITYLNFIYDVTTFKLQKLQLRKKL